MSCWIPTPTKSPNLSRYHFPFRRSGRGLGRERGWADQTPRMSHWAQRIYPDPVKPCEVAITTSTLQRRRLRIGEVAAHTVPRPYCSPPLPRVTWLDSEMPGCESSLPDLTTLPPENLRHSASKGRRWA